MDPSLFPQLDHELREVRRRLEERRHLGKVQKEAVNDIRRYRQRAKRSGPDLPPVHATLLARIDDAVLDATIAERDRLREAVVDGATLESRWSDLVADRERRLSPLPRPLVDRLGEVEERRGVLTAQMKVAERVQSSGAAAHAALGRVRPVLEAPDADTALVEAVAAAQAALLAFRREVKHLHRDAGQVDAELVGLLSFTDDLLRDLAAAAAGEAVEATAAVRAREALVVRLVEEAERLLHVRQRAVHALEAEQEAAAGPA